MIKLVFLGGLTAGLLMVAMFDLPAIANAQLSSWFQAELLEVGNLDQEKLAQKTEKFSTVVYGFAFTAHSAEPLSEVALSSYRTAIKESFVEAYNAIEKIEQIGELAPTELARAEMQRVIEDYMESPIADRYLIITKDLDTYSRFMTNVLIERSSLKYAAGEITF